MNKTTRANVANWKFYAKRTIEEEDLVLRGREGRKGGRTEPLECVNAAAVRSMAP
jgi:hypothetical protein